jgi:hypothetical protein
VVKFSDAWKWHMANFSGGSSVRRRFHGGRWGVVGLVEEVAEAPAFDPSKPYDIVQPERSAQDENLYDVCLVDHAGNTVACNALMRVLDRLRADEAANKKEAAPAPDPMGGFTRAPGRQLATREASDFAQRPILD